MPVSDNIPWNQNQDSYCSHLVICAYTFRAAFTRVSKCNWFCTAILYLFFKLHIFFMQTKVKPNASVTSLHVRFPALSCYLV